MNARSVAFLAAMAMALSLFCATHVSAQKCPHGPIDIVALTAHMETTKDPKVILRAAAIAGQQVLPTLRGLSILETSPETVGGMAQASLAKLGDEATYAELESELDRKDFAHTLWTLEKLLIVNTPRSIAMLMAYLNAHPGPITLGCEVDHCYDDVPLIFNALADVVENAPIRTNGKFTGSREDWINWSKHEKTDSVFHQRRFAKSLRAMPGAKSGMGFPHGARGPGCHRPPTCGACHQKTGNDGLPL